MATADAVFTIHGSLEAGKAFYTDVKGRLARYGRVPSDVKILPAATALSGWLAGLAGDLDDASPGKAQFQASGVRLQDS